MSWAALPSTSTASRWPTRPWSAPAADAILLGAVGGRKWDNLDRPLRPERAS